MLIHGRRFRNEPVIRTSAVTDQKSMKNCNIAYVPIRKGYALNTLITLTVLM